jgi:hypothetical protein
LSFDIFIQRFAQGDVANFDPTLVLETLREFVDNEPTKEAQTITTADGSADIYGLGSPRGLMINHAAGEAIWDAIVAIARAGDLTIMPVGCPVCVTRPELLDDLPGVLSNETRVVSNGSELLRAITA